METEATDKIETLAPSEEETTAEAPALPTYNEDGVDLTLIRWMLSLTPQERLQVLQRTMEGIERLRNAQSRL
jgi:tripartite-type tricarboxylate transporter receptor subunit TctC